MWAHDPRSAQDGSTSSEKCTPVWSDNFKRQNLPTLLLQSAHTSFPLSIGKIILSKIFENSPKNKNCRQKNLNNDTFQRRWRRKNHKRKFEFRLICRQEKVSFYRGNFPNLSGSNTILKLLWVGKTLPFIYMLKLRAVPLTYLLSQCFCSMSVTGNWQLRLSIVLNGNNQVSKIWKQKNISLRYIGHYPSLFLFGVLSIWKDLTLMFLSTAFLNMSGGTPNKRPTSANRWPHHHLKPKQEREGEASNLRTNITNPQHDKFMNSICHSFCPPPQILNLFLYIKLLFWNLLYFDRIFLISGCLTWRILPVPAKLYQRTENANLSKNTLKITIFSIKSMYQDMILMSKIVWT